jgi:hypothetical protein
MPRPCSDGQDPSATQCAHINATVNEYQASPVPSGWAIG